MEALCRDFEQQRVCYLPFNMFLLRPLHRLLHYKLILERLCKHYPPTHDDFRDCRGTARCLYTSLHLQCLRSCSDLSSVFQHPWLTSPRWCCNSKGPWWKWRTFRSFWSWRKIWLASITSPSLEGLESSTWFQRCAQWVMVIFKHH